MLRTKLLAKLVANVGVAFVHMFVVVLGTRLTTRMVVVKAVVLLVVLVR
jgi:hypothetical protein